jgi:hypothetical protein
MVRARWGSLAFQNLCHSGLEPDSGRDDEEFSGGSESEEGKGERYRRICLVVAELRVTTVLPVSR